MTTHEWAVILACLPATPRANDCGSAKGRNRGIRECRAALERLQADMEKVGNCEIVTLTRAGPVPEDYPLPPFDSLAGRLLRAEVEETMKMRRSDD